MSDPFEYFDPSANAPKQAAAKVDISPSPSGQPRPSANPAAQQSPYQQPQPASHAPNPYKMGPGASQAAPAQKPSSQNLSPYSVPPSSGHSGHSQPSAPYAQPQAQGAKPGQSHHAPQAQPGRGNPYALPPQPSAPQGGFAHGQPHAPQARAPQAAPASSQQHHREPSPQPQSKSPSNPNLGQSAAAPAVQHIPHPAKFAEGPELWLPETDRKQFLDCGFVIVPNIVSEDLRKKALLAINRSLGRNSVGNRSTTSCSELISTEPILNLFHASGVASLASRLIGPGYYPPPYSFINLQYPGDGCVEDQPPTEQSEQIWRMPEPIPNWQTYWKIDGLPAPASSGQEHFIRNYSLLVAVFLSDIHEQDAGNVVLWPGSHLGIQAMLRARGGTAAALKAGKLDRPVIHQHQLEAVPQQITANAGDVALIHYQVAHTHAPNLSPDIRYVVYFRLYSKHHTPNTMRPEAMDNVFLDYEGLYDIIGRSHPK